MNVDLSGPAAGGRVLSELQPVQDESVVQMTDSTKPRRTVAVEPDETTSDQRLIAMFAHLLGIVTGPFGALVILLVKKGDDWVETEAREALNFQISVLLAWFCGFVLMIIMIGGIIIVLVSVLNVIFCVMAAAHVHAGDSYRYPLTLRLIGSPNQK